MASEKDVAAEIASELASLQAEQGSEAETEEAAPEGDSVETDPEASEELEETETEEPVSAIDSGIDAEALRTEIADLIDGGDLKAAAEKLGLDPSIFKLNNRQFKASRTTAREAKAAAAEAATKAAAALAAQTQAEQLNQKAEEIYGPVVAGKHFYQQGDVLKARAAIELMFDDTLENIVANLAKGAKGMDPAQLEVLKLRRELDAEKAAKATETAAAATAQEQATQVAGIAAKLKGTPLEALADEAAAEIQKVIQASYNKALGRHTKTLKEAYAEVKGQYALRAAKLATFGKPPVKPAVKDKREPLNRTKLAPKVPGKRLTAEQEFEMELAAAKKDTAAAARRDQRKAR